MAAMELDRVRTYHCICSTLILTTVHNLTALPTRKDPVQDGAIILPFPIGTSGEEDAGADSTSTKSVLSNVAPDRKAIIIRREDGFEKRVLLRCNRCKVVLGYELDGAHYDGDSEPGSKALFLLPGGLVSTDDMATGVQPQAPAWAVATN